MDKLYAIIDRVVFFMGFNIDSDLRDEIHFRCSGFEDGDINVEDNIKACLRYAIDKGMDALINEEDDGEIWEYC